MRAPVGLNISEREIMRMSRWVLATLGAAVLVVAPAEMQARQMNFYIPPNCELDTQHYLVRNAELYVKAATETSDPEERAGRVADAIRVLQDALDQGEMENAAVWYFLARAYALGEDHPGTDSSFSKAEALEPSCADDVDTHRRFIWPVLFDEGIAAYEIDDLVTAEAKLSQANVYRHNEPNIPFYLGMSRVRSGQNAAAIDPFKVTVQKSEPDGPHSEIHQIAFFNVARLYHMTQQWDSAAVWYNSYRTLMPDDVEAITGLAIALESGGRLEQAMAAYDTVVARAELVRDVDLFRAGVVFFQARRFDAAVGAFQAGLQKNPHYRDGIYNLTQTYLALANPDDPEDYEPSPEELAERTDAATAMLENAKQLNEIDPANENAKRLMAAAYQLIGEIDSTQALMDEIESMPFEVNVTAFQAIPGGFAIQGTVQNKQAESVEIPAIVVEFLDVSGAVVATEVFEPGTLSASGSTRFDFRPTLEGIAAWRYRIGS